MTAPPMLALCAVDLAARIRAGEFSAEDVVEAHIRQIEAVQPRVNALAADRFECARREAAAADCARAAGDARPLLGVPFTVKELIEVAGMPLTFGSVGRRERRGTCDATVVARLRAAGAIPLGVTNLPEWGMWFESYNHVYGRTNNPHDVRRSAGGSSGGEGAVVGAGGSVFGLGSDIGGSVRMPAGFCGTYGHKPTNGLLPLTGHYPVYAAGPDAGLRKTSPYVTIGTLTRSARDIAPLLRIMGGADGVDPNTAELPLRDPAAVDWRNRRVVLLPSPAMARTRAASPVLRAAVRRAGASLEARGAHIVEAPHDLLYDAGVAWFAALQSVGGAAFAELLGGGRRINVAREVVLTAAGRGTYSWPALFFCIGEVVGRRGERALQRALACSAQLARKFDEAVGDHGVLIMPTHPRVAPRHNHAVLRPFDFLYTAAFNALRVPATAVPVGFDGDGMPLSVQVVSARGNDHLTIAAALALEEDGGPWRPAPLRPGAARSSSGHRSKQHSIAEIAEKRGGPRST